jgi:hypothetical protein
MGGRRWNGPAPAQEDTPPMQEGSKQQRPRGTGHLKLRRDRAGRLTYYAKFRAPGGRQVMRKLGAARRPGSTVGLTKAQAEAALRRAIETERAAPPVVERIDVGGGGTPPPAPPRDARSQAFDAR